MKKRMASIISLWNFRHFEIWDMINTYNSKITIFLEKAILYDPLPSWKKTKKSAHLFWLNRVLIQGVPLTYTPFQRPNYNCLRQSVDTTLKYIYLSFSVPNFRPLWHYLMYFIQVYILVVILPNCRQKSMFFNE